MVLSVADLERAEQYLEPLSYVTETGITVTAHQVRDPNDPAGLLWVAYKTYTPANPEQPLATCPAVLFIHDMFQSGQLYHDAALNLAECGVLAASLSLGLHGSGRWYSHDGWRPEELTVERYSRHVQLVIQALPVAPHHLGLAGGGVLGSLLAQQVALDLPVAGIALLGGCLPHLAAATWTGQITRKSWWQRGQSHSSPALIPPPDQDSIRVRWLGYGVPGVDVFAVWQLLCAESPHVRLAYESLAGQPISAPSLPALVMAGEQDALVRRELLELTATVYGVQPVIIPGAPHLLARSPQLKTVTKLLAAFCQATVSASVPSM